MKYLLILALSVILFSCGNNTEQRTDGFTKQPKTKEDSLYDEVLAGHDVAMAKMGKIKGAIQVTGQAIDSVKKLPNTTANAAYASELMGMHQSLKNADSLMDDWMRRFNVDSFENDKPKRIEYLSSEKNKVTHVKDLILGSLEKTDSLLK